MMRAQLLPRPTTAALEYGALAVSLTSLAGSVAAVAHTDPMSDLAAGRSPFIAGSITYSDEWVALTMSLAAVAVVAAVAATVIAHRRGAMQRVAASESVALSARYEALIDRSWALIAVIGSDERLSSVSGAWERLLGRQREEAIGSAVRDWLHPDDLSGVRVAHREMAEPGASAAVRCRLLHADGTWRWFDAMATNLAADPTVQGTLITARDVTAEVDARQALEFANARFVALLQHGFDLITVSDAHGTLLYVSPGLPNILARRVQDTEGRPLMDLVHPDDRERAGSQLARAVNDHDAVVSFACRVSHGDGGWRHVEVTAANRFDDPAVGGLVCNMRDVTERVHVTDRLQYQAMHDGLTGLPNRVLLLRRLGEALERGRQNGFRCSLLYLDLDGFKKVNDSLGHAAGDAVLTAVAERLRAAVRPSDVVARLGGDEFVLLVDDVVDTDVVAEIANRVRAAISRPIRVADRSIMVGCSIGIAVSDHSTPVALLQAADTALYRAKERGRNRWEMYDKTMSAEARRRLDTEELLRRALDDDGLVLVYQPIVDLADGRPTGVEALLRLRSTDGHLLGPSEFIDVAEESGLIVPVGAGVLDRACRQASEWQIVHPDTPFRVSVNISPRQLTSPGLVTQVQHTLAAWELPADRLCLELTENALIDAGLAVRSSLRDLKRMGVSIAIDDFGTGWSSLGYLRRFPIDIVKIDRSFVSGLGADNGDTEVVRAVVGLGRALGLEVVAEGVETPEQAALLRELGCDRAQGYLFGRPASPTDVRVRGEVAPAVG